jgi:hypothetical protein
MHLIMHFIMLLYTLICTKTAPIKRAALDYYSFGRGYLPSSFMGHSTCLPVTSYHWLLRTM